MNTTSKRVQEAVQGGSGKGFPTCRASAARLRVATPLTALLAGKMTRLFVS